MFTYDKPDNLVEMFELSLARHAERPLFGTPDQNGTYTWASYKDIGKRIDNLRAALAQQGVTAGDAVGIIANNRTEWAVAAFATFGLGARFVPMYEKELPKIWKHIIKDSSLKVLFVANNSIYKAITEIRAEVPELLHLFVIDGDGETSMKYLEQQGEKSPVTAITPQPTDTAVLIYTSGTTGDPKGVLLSHGNFTSNVIAGGKLFPEFSHEDRSLSILPWAHSYGQTAELYNFIYFGGSMGFIREVSTIVQDMKNVAPTFLIAVPRVFNKIYDGIWSKMKETGGLALKIFTMGLESAASLRNCATQGKPPLLAQVKYAIADGIVFKKIRQGFGGHLSGALTASAMMNQEVAQFFVDIGIPVFDAYGLSETSPAVTMNCRNANKPGSVGRPLDKVRVVIDREFMEDDEKGAGEIVVYGPNVMQGYHNKPEATKAVMTDDGGFRTGDLGYIDEDGFLFITGRIKEQYKLENGKYVFPASIEEEIQLSPWVENVFVYGEGRSHNICIIAPDFKKLSAWAAEKGLEAASSTELVALPETEAMIRESITAQLKGKFGGYEIPRQFILVEEPFSVDNGMLTHTMKLKRRKVLDRYKENVDLAYGL
ncbi:long-chain fatty acid--CoA ligase [Desulforhopalus sp. IMCC35007]|uniref:AMP-dependent synthetase/ligase n=1 Tax=Desulforhopalus sp. IMCC35007 TaxID=2569543 RepID=UPI0010AED3E3|nr:long-chain fatty acid--CoA ligase [Desulforhopalus sp. IMCC35007]TKB07146.1 long-chain fatty acid--CoA ligase [Desulforhopalus sp. IMCC35007]